jgi:hypothetical protein
MVSGVFSNVWQVAACALNRAFNCCMVLRLMTIN